MKTIPDSHKDLISDQRRAFVALATTMNDGSPQVSPVWFNTDGEYILINSAKGRLKDRNIRARPQVALTILDPSDPYRYLLVRGRVAEITEEGAREHINVLAGKYRDEAYFELNHSDEVRVTYKISTERVFASG